MCEPVTITATMMWVMAGVGAVAAGAAMYSAKQSVKRQVKAMDKANQIQSDQMSQQAGAAMMQEAREARRETAEGRATASESGINLGSNSFLAIMQNSMFNESFDNGLVGVNESNQQQARQSEYSSRMASINIPTNLGIGLSMVQGGVSGYAGAVGMQQAGSANALNGGTSGASTKSTKNKGG